MRDKVETYNGHIFIRLKSGRRITFWDNISTINSARSALGRGISRAFALVSSDYDLEVLEVHIGDLEDYIQAIRKYLDDVRGIKTVEERIALLRNNPGRTPGETAAYNAKADELEQRLRETS